MTARVLLQRHSIDQRLAGALVYGQKSKAKAYKYVIFAVED